MDLLKWKIIKEKNKTVFYAKGMLYRDWEIHSTGEGYTVKLPVGDVKSYSWDYFTFGSLAAAKSDCEAWNKDFLLDKFTPEERNVLYRFFDLIDRINEPD
jgi:hypothetical protein